MGIRRFGHYGWHLSRKETDSEMNVLLHNLLTLYKLPIQAQCHKLSNLPILSVIFWILNSSLNLYETNLVSAELFWFRFLWVQLEAKHMYILHQVGTLQRELNSSLNKKLHQLLSWGNGIAEWKRNHCMFAWIEAGEGGRQVRNSQIKVFPFLENDRSDRPPCSLILLVNVLTGNFTTCHRQEHIFMNSYHCGIFLILPPPPSLGASSNSNEMAAYPASVICLLREYFS